ncbi:LysR family transcriptional regulator [Variovorax paradoxus]|nr:LysR family transcriptional regulator [Variovorax paradoxus]MCT8173888.1 LysR family transcriptional regulator [Variovorax sp. CY25R-8]KPV12477.1 LysR family transcriptional regulator [Variovorax paradoxus]KPV12759.1 LysR family transcriptional regulator [Variovorax paradoxus]KPV24923.1 LysR family transcriptional regulator [Variovorax paradoxus]
MDRAHLMTVFLAVAEAQNFAAAARHLGMSAPAVTRAIAALEEHLGVKLILRTTRSVRLTDVGHRYLEDVKLILAKLADAAETARGVSSAVQGHLNVTAPALFGISHVMPCIEEYLGRFPRMSISGYFLDRIVDLREEGMDVAIRIGFLADTGLKAIRVGQVRRVLCASPDYLKAHGTPRDPSELARHAIVSAAPLSPGNEWRFRSGDADLALRLAPRLIVGTNDAAIEAVVRGSGIAQLLSYQIATHRQAGRLAIVLADHEEPPWPIHVVCERDRWESPRAREFVELLVHRLRGREALN